MENSDEYRQCGDGDRERREDFSDHGRCSERNEKQLFSSCALPRKEFGIRPARSFPILVTHTEGSRRHFMSLPYAFFRVRDVYLSVCPYFHRTSTRGSHDEIGV